MFFNTKTPTQNQIGFGQQRNISPSSGFGNGSSSIFGAATPNRAASPSFGGIGSSNTGFSPLNSNQPKVRFFNDSFLK